MKFLLFCEGETERIVLPSFLKRWLDKRLHEQRLQPVGITPVKFEGWHDLYREAGKKAHLRLKEKDVLAVISLLDLYGPTFYPSHLKRADDKYDWAKRRMEERVGHPRFRQFFAVHEVEAWLLSDPEIFPRKIQSGLRGKVERPETVNFHEPPGKLLDRLYRAKMRRGYRKTTDGKILFAGLSPKVAVDKCPRLAEMLDEMLSLARKG